MLIRLRSLSEVLKQSATCQSFCVVIPGKATLQSHIGWIRDAKVQPDYLGMASKLGYGQECLDDFPWIASESTRDIFLETRMLSENSRLADVASLLNKEDCRSATLQELLSLLEERHPSKLHSAYAIFAESGEIVIAAVSSAGWVFQKNPCGDQILSHWILPLVYK